MKKILLTTLLFLPLYFLSSCDPSSPEATDSLNPNGDSELALLMRDMTTWTEEQTKRLKEGQALQPVPASFQTLITAQPTDMGLDTLSLRGYGRLWLEQLSAFEQAGETEKVEAHNNLVRSCRSCHEQFCRGPLKRIDRMLVVNS